MGPRLKLFVLLTCAVLVGTALGLANRPASAASISICDAGACGTADPNITFTANNFGTGFIVNEITIQQGYDNPGSTTVSENSTFLPGFPAQNFFGGGWFIGPNITPTTQTIFFTEAGGGISDILHYVYGEDPIAGLGLLSGYVISDESEPLSVTDLASLGIFPTATLPEDSPYDFSNTGITAVFQSDIETPLPAALPLFATGLSGLGLLGWRRKRKAKAIAGGKSCRV